MSSYDANQNYNQAASDSHQGCPPAHTVSDLDLFRVLPVLLLLLVGHLQLSVDVQASPFNICRLELNLHGSFTTS